MRLARGDARGIHPAHLSGADADGGEILGIDDGVGFDMLGDAEREPEITQLRIGRRTPGHGLERDVIGNSVVTTLHQQAAGDGLRRQACGARIGQAAREQETQIAPLGDDRNGFLGRIRRNDDFSQDFSDDACSVGIERVVDCDDAAIR